MARNRTPITGPRKGIHLREWRTFRGYPTQTDLAIATGITRATICRLESGKLQYRQALLDRLASVLRCAPGELIDFNPYDFAPVIMLYESMTPAQQKEAVRRLKKLAQKEK